MTEVVTFEWKNGAMVSLRADGGGEKKLAALCAKFGPPWRADWNPLIHFKRCYARRILAKIQGIRP